MLVSRLFWTVWRSPTLMTWASMTLRIGGLAVLVPIVLTRLKTQEVLVWQVLSTITTLINWTDFGFSPTFSRIIAFSRGGGRLADLHGPKPRRADADASGAPDRLSIPAVLGTQRVIYRMLVGGATVLALTLGTATLLRPVSGLEHPIDGWIAWAFTIVASQIILLNGANISVLTGFDRIATARRTDFAVGAIQLASTSAVALSGAGLVAIVGCYSFWQLPLFLLNRWNVSRLDTGIDHRSPAVLDRAVFRSVWPAAWRSGIGAFMSAGIIQISGLVCAQVAAPAAAAAYLLALRMMTVINQLAQAPFYSKLPTLARLYAAKQTDELLRLARRGMVISYWTFTLGALALIVAAPYLLRLIRSSVAFPDFYISALLALAFFTERYGGMHIQLYSLKNHIVWHVVSGVTAVIMILVFVSLFPLVGVIAMPAAMLCGYLGFHSWYSARLSARSLNIKRWDFERRTVVGPAVTLIVGLGVYWLFAIRR